MHRRIMSKHQQFSRGHVGKQEWDMSPRHHYHQYWRVNNAEVGGGGNDFKKVMVHLSTPRIAVTTGACAN